MHIDKINYKNAELSADNDTVILKGEIDQENAEILLNPFFTNVISQMDDTVILDLRNLEFLNSGGIKALITFILKRKKGTTIVIKANKVSTWQRTSLKVVASLDAHIRIE